MARDFNNRTMSFKWGFSSASSNDPPPAYESSKFPYRGNGGDSDDNDGKEPSAPYALMPDTEKYERVVATLDKIGKPALLHTFVSNDLDDDVVELLYNQGSKEFHEATDRMGLSMGESLKFFNAWPKTASSAHGGAATPSSSRGETLRSIVAAENAIVAATPEKSLHVYDSWIPSRFTWYKVFDEKYGDDGTCAFFAIGDYVPRGVFSVGGSAVGIFAVGGYSVGIVSLGGLSMGCVAVSQCLAFGLIIGLAQFLSIGSVTVAQLFAVGTVRSVSQIGMGTGLFVRGDWGLFGNTDQLFPRPMNDTGTATECGATFTEDPIHWYSLMWFLLLAVVMFAVMNVIRENYEEKWKKKTGRVTGVIYGNFYHLSIFATAYWIVALILYIYLWQGRSSGRIDVKQVLLNYFGCIQEEANA